jgi:hypothetical protein
MSEKASGDCLIGYGHDVVSWGGRDRPGQGGALLVRVDVGSWKLGCSVGCPELIPFLGMKDIGDGPPLEMLARL